MGRSRREVDRFHREFLITRDVPVTDEPKDYPQYWPGYYAVFFDDPINGIHWELAWVPKVPSPRQVWSFYRALRAFAKSRTDLAKTVPGVYPAGEANPASSVGLKPASTASIWLISACRNRKRASSSFLRRIQLVTSALHLLALHERQHGTTLVTS